MLKSPVSLTNPSPPSIRNLKSLMVAAYCESNQPKPAINPQLAELSIQRELRV